MRRVAGVGARRLGAASCGVVLTAMLVVAAPGGATDRGKAALACPLPPGTATPSEGTPSSRLLSILGVLRRPQTASDALPPPFDAGGPGLTFGEGVYVKFIRRARVVAGTTYYLVPVADGPGPHCSAREGVSFATVEALGQGSGSPATVGEIEHGRWIGHSGVQYGVVPDGVQKVTLRYPARHRLRATVTVTVLENVYVAKAPPAARASVSPVLPKAVVWRSATGSVLERFHSS